MAAKKDVAKVEESGLPAGMNIDDLIQDAEDLNPELDTGDIALPYIYVLQSNSPQANPGLPEYVEGAVASMFLNNVSAKAYEARENGVTFVPCFYERRYVEWVHRDNGGGWVADHDINSNIMANTRPDDKGKPRLPNGNVVVETAYHYGLMLDEDTSTWFQCVIPMKSTALKKNRSWNNDISENKIPGHDVKAPRFMFPYNLRTVLETKGDNSWWNFKITRHEEAVNADLYDACKKYAQLIKSGLLTRVVEGGVTEEGTPYDTETGEVLDGEGNFA